MAKYPLSKSTINLDNDSHEYIHYIIHRYVHVHDTVKTTLYCTLRNTLLLDSLDNAVHVLRVKATQLCNNGLNDSSPAFISQENILFCVQDHWTIVTRISKRESEPCMETRNGLPENVSVEFLLPLSHQHVFSFHEFVHNKEDMHGIRIRAFVDELHSAVGQYKKQILSMKFYMKQNFSHFRVSFVLNFREQEDVGIVSSKPSVVSANSQP